LPPVASPTVPAVALVCADPVGTVSIIVAWRAGTLVNILTLESVTSETLIACAVVSTHSVRAGGMSMALVLALITLVKIKAAVFLWGRAENGVDLESIGASAIEARGLVVTLNTLANTRVCTNGTLVNILTDAASSIITGIARACVAADCVGTSGMIGTLVVVTGALVDVNAVETVSGVASIAFAGVRAGDIGTRGIVMTIIVVGVGTLVIVNTRDTIARVTGVTCTCECAGMVCTGGIGMAVVAAIVAFIVVNA